MKIAVLGDPRPGYIRPMMEGIVRMLQELECEPVLLLHGIRMLSQQSGWKGRVKNVLFRLYMSKLKDCDAIIVVQHLEDAFRATLNVEGLRHLFPEKPVILYDLVYLPTVGRWGPWVKPAGSRMWGTEGNLYYGMDRYDWYFCASVQNRLPMPDTNQPCSQIGLSLSDGTLFPEQKGQFRALIDFERDAFPQHRDIQIKALEETGTEYVVLKGRYSMEDIRAIYRTCSIYFPAHMESFGLPICELQACGCRIMTPYAGWCDAHRLSVYEKSGGLPPNFVVYDNDQSLLSNAIRESRSQSTPDDVLKSFRENHGHFLTGDLSALQNALDRIRQGQITSQSHMDYAAMTAQILLRRSEPCDAEGNLM